MGNLVIFERAPAFCSNPFLFLLASTAQNDYLSVPMPDSTPQPIQVTDGSIMLVPLFHSTGSIFAESIKLAGLGAENPHQTLGTLAFMREMVETSPTVLVGLKNGYAAIVEMMLEQNAGEMMNFRHGGTYLSAESFTAKKYALSNRRYGSELLTHAFMVFDNLEQKEPGLAADLAEKYALLMERRSADSRPVLVEALGVPISSLRSEGAKDPTGTIRTMQWYANRSPEARPAQLHQLWSQLNFELTAAVPVENLLFHEIEMPE